MPVGHRGNGTFRIRAAVHPAGGAAGLWWSTCFHLTGSWWYLVLLQLAAQQFVPDGDALLQFTQRPVGKELKDRQDLLETQI